MDMNVKICNIAVFKKKKKTLILFGLKFKPIGCASISSDLNLYHTLLLLLLLWEITLHQNGKKEKKYLWMMLSSFFSCLVAGHSPSHVPCSLLVETLLSLTRWHRDDAIPTRPLSLHCLPNNKHRAKGSPMAYIVITYSERTHATSPHSLVFVLPFLPINFHRHRSQSCQSFSPC